MLRRMYACARLTEAKTNVDMLIIDKIRMVSRISVLQADKDKEILFLKQVVFGSD